MTTTLLLLLAPLVLAAVLTATAPPTAVHRARRIAARTVVPARSHRPRHARTAR